MHSSQYLPTFNPFPNAYNQQFVVAKEIQLYQNGHNGEGIIYYYNWLEIFNHHQANLNYQFDIMPSRIAIIDNRSRFPNYQQNRFIAQINQNPNPASHPPQLNIKPKYKGEVNPFADNHLSNETLKREAVIMSVQSPRPFFSKKQQNLIDSQSASIPPINPTEIKQNLNPVAVDRQDFTTNELGNISLVAKSIDTKPSTQEAVVMSSAPPQDQVYYRSQSIKFPKAHDNEETASAFPTTESSLANENQDQQVQAVIISARPPQDLFDSQSRLFSNPESSEQYYKTNSVSHGDAKEISIYDKSQDRQARAEVMPVLPPQDLFNPQSELFNSPKIQQGSESHSHDFENSLTAQRKISVSPRQDTIDFDFSSSGFLQHLQQQGSEMTNTNDIPSEKTRTIQTIRVQGDQQAQGKIQQKRS